MDSIVGSYFLALRASNFSLEFSRTTLTIAKSMHSERHHLPRFRHSTGEVIMGISTLWTISWPRSLKDIIKCWAFWRHIPTGRCRFKNENPIIVPFSAQTETTNGANEGRMANWKSIGYNWNDGTQTHWQTDWPTYLRAPSTELLNNSVRRSQGFAPTLSIIILFIQSTLGKQCLCDEL